MRKTAPSVSVQIVGQSCQKSNSNSKTKTRPSGLTVRPGRDWDYQTFARHFAESYTPTVEEIVEVLREEATCEHLDFADTLTGAKCLTCGLEVNE